MKPLLKLLVTSFLFMPALVLAENLIKLNVKHSVTINAEIEAVWDMVSQFDAMHQWHPFVFATAAETGNDPGTIRTLILKNDETITERLISFDEENRMFQYEIVSMSVVNEVNVEGERHGVPVFPVSSYKSTMSVKPKDEGTQVTWEGEFFRAYTGQYDAPSEMTNSIATSAVRGMYRRGLEELQTILEN